MLTSLPGAGRRAHDSDALDHVARIGLVAYGVVHLLIAVLAIRLAFGAGGGSASQQGALAELARQPFGKILLWAVVIGLLCLVLWRAEEAALGHRDADGGERIRKRVASGAKAAVYAALAVSGIKIAVGSHPTGSNKSSDTWTARLMDLPAGQVLVVIAGLTVVGLGGYLVYGGFTGKVRDELDAEGRSGDTGTAYVALGNVGHVAKGISIGLVGALIVYAGITHDPHHSGGLDQALHALLQQPFGVVLLVLVGFGLGCYGLFSLARARHLDR